MTYAKIFFSSAVFIVGACSGAPDVSRSTTTTYQLQLSHPAPYATYIQVLPESTGAPLPTPEQITSPDFSVYLRRMTGCVRDTRRPTEALGSPQVPSGYMVPISCL